MGICEVLTIIFIVAKLFGFITWGWFFVLLPEIIAVALYVIVFVLGLFGVHVFNKKAERHMKYHFEDDFWR